MRKKGFRNEPLSSVSQQVGREHLLLGRQILFYSSNLVLKGSPNCLLFCFVGRQPKRLRTTALYKQIIIKNVLFLYH